MKIFLVRPHPPAAILARIYPVSEAYKYNWQPMALKYIAYNLNQAFGDKLDIKIWHLMDKEEDRRFEEVLILEKPEIVIFSEIDILVNEVDKLAGIVKKHLPGTWTIAGGKHTSLLKTGDKLPFRAVDYAIKGDGIKSLVEIVAARMGGKKPVDCPAVINVDGQGRVAGHEGYDKRTDISAIDGIKLQSFGIEGHPIDEYFENHQIHPALISGKIRTATVFAGSGCPYRCVFCQSPVEHGGESNIVLTRPPEKIAEEIAWLVKKYGVNNIFSLEANLNLLNWLKTYECLEQHGISTLPVSGFIRAGDIMEVYRSGILIKLVRKGMRFLSIGLDIPLNQKKDIYCKAFSQTELMECLSVCESLGIIILATFVGDPDYTLEELKRQLQFLAEAPVAAVDIRLSIALRNTEYYRKVAQWLVYHPDKNHKFFNRQNYRYQTINIPGKISPVQTYNAVRSFQKNFLTGDRHIDYVLRFIKRFPESMGYFRNQYAPLIKNAGKMSPKMQELEDIMELQEGIE